MFIFPLFPFNADAGKRNTEYFSSPRSYQVIRGVNYRTSPDKNSPKYGTLKKGQTVMVSGIVKGWYQIVLQDGGNAYAWNTYLEPVSGGFSTPVRQSYSSKSASKFGSVCPNPSYPCSTSDYTFRPYELSFILPNELKWRNIYKSVSFYAILLKSIKTVPAEEHDDECSGYFSETDRLRVQAMFPSHKVFASRFGCHDFVYYTNTNEKYNFLAVYGGKTKPEAQNVLAKVRRTGRFSGSNIRKMQVVLDYGD
ncbi:SH3 domain-containing protein [Desulfonema magnum]|uniref:SH3 domain-containing protein n=1 Tax=Desulfonema magnum TaxID=45655 RepID=A0A975BGU4_9BACT|nr:SH3 domain-containing protein [Desulfonema magnum]